MMGVDFPNDNFDKIDLLCEMDRSWNDLNSKHSSVDNLFVDHDNGHGTPLCLTWLESADEEASFSVVKSRKNKKVGRKTCTPMCRPNTRGRKDKDTSTLAPGRPVRQRNPPERFK
jgi:hypothetical protein